MHLILFFQMVNSDHHGYLSPKKKLLMPVVFLKKLLNRCMVKMVKSVKVGLEVFGISFAFLFMNEFHDFSNLFYGLINKKIF